MQSNPLERLVVVQVPVHDIRENSYNPNKQSTHEFELLRLSIRSDGFTQPIIVNRISMEVVDGEHRWRAAMAEGYESVPVVFVEMTPEQMRVATLLHNRARGTEHAGKAADVLRDLVSMGALDEAKMGLMMDQVEMDRLAKEVASNASELLKITTNVPDDMLGADGKGLTDEDKRAGVDTSADHRRARDKLLAQKKEAEEKSMTAEDNAVYRLVLLFSGDDAVVVERVLGKEPVKAILELCREAQASP